MTFRFSLAQFVFKSACFLKKQILQFPNSFIFNLKHQTNNGNFFEQGRGKFPFGKKILNVRVFFFSFYLYNVLFFNKINLLFSKLTEIGKYRKIAYEISNRSYPAYFQFMYVKVNISENDLTFNSELLHKVKKKNCKARCAPRATFQYVWYSGGNKSIRQQKFKQQLVELNSNMSFSNVRNPNIVTECCKTPSNVISFLSLTLLNNSRIEKKSIYMKKIKNIALLTK